MSSSDQKMRWGGLLENPLISKVQRAMLDSGRVSGLRKVLSAYTVQSVLDVGCGLGDYGVLFSSGFFGIDNSYPRIEYARRRFPHQHFLTAEAGRLPFRNSSFDMVMLVDTSHHFADHQLHQVLLELKRVARKFIVLSDPFVSAHQNFFRTLVYRLDRGACFRTIAAMEKSILAVGGITIIDRKFFRTFPGLYDRVVLVVQLS